MTQKTFPLGPQIRNFIEICSDETYERKEYKSVPICHSLPKNKEILIFPVISKF